MYLITEYHKTELGIWGHNEFHFSDVYRSVNYIG